MKVKQKILLDTHMLLWWQLDDAAMKQAARRLVLDPEKRIFVSVLSLWEIVIKVGAGKLEADIDQVLEELLNDGFEVVPFLAAHVREVLSLPQHHRDPFDRGLIATALTEGMSFLTSDTLLKQYGDVVVVN